MVTAEKLLQETENSGCSCRILYILVAFVQSLRASVLARLVSQGGYGSLLFARSMQRRLAVVIESYG